MKPFLSDEHVKRMSENVDRFFSDLKKCRCSFVFSDLFVRTSDVAGEIDLEKVKEHFEFWSPGEQIMFSFFLNIFLGRDEYVFSLVQAGKRLDDNNLRIIAKWLKDPYFP